MSSNYELQKTNDGSYTYYSKEYGQSYHSVKEGALSETLYKHVIPAFTHHETKDELVILDICFGLGLNTLTSIYYNQQHHNKKLKIYSPELDEKLISTLMSLPYPKELEPILSILRELVEHQVYKDELLSIELFLGDAREYIKKFENFFDVVYQDAFSPVVNPMLWTVEYFSDITKTMKKDGLLTSYSIALSTRLALEQNGYHIYVHEGRNFRKSTLASLSELENYEKVNMAHKKAMNPNASPLHDMSKKLLQKIPSKKKIVLTLIAGIFAFYLSLEDVLSYLDTGTLDSSVRYYFFYDQQAVFASIALNILGFALLVSSWSFFRKRKKVLKRH